MHSTCQSRLSVWSAAALVLLLAPIAFAEGETALGEYAASVRERVVGKIREALGGRDRRSEVSGTVTFAGDGAFFLQNGADGLKVLSGSCRLPNIGDRVRVSGSPSLEGGRVVFVAEGWTKHGSDVLPAPRIVTSADLIDAKGRVHALRISVTGRAIGETENGFAMKVDDVPVNVMIRSMPDFLSGCERTHPQVMVTGVAELMLDQSVLLGREGYVMGVKVDVGNAADIVLKPDLVYLATRRDRVFMRIVGLLLAVLLVSLLAFVVIVFRQRRGLFRTRTIMAERKRMADDLHDTIEQHLVGAGMLLKVNRLKEAQDVLVRAKREIRDIVWGLKNDDMMRLGPAEMLRTLAHEENTKGIFRVDTRLEGLPASLDAATMRDLSLIVREAIGNAVKHGEAKKIAISSDPMDGGGWLLRISNDGAPFDPENAPGAKDGHFGLEGMKQRARRIGATLGFEHRGKGMVLVLRKRA